MFLAAAVACGRAPEAARGKAPPVAEPPPSLLLVTLDTTRADAVAPETRDPTATPHLAAFAARAVRFAHAYATAPATLPSHASMLTGLYPAGHGLHENGRRLAEQHPVVAERLARLGYTTAAFVSGYPLERQFGLARGFAHYDDAFGDRPQDVERGAAATVDRALAYVDAQADGAAAPLFLWTHFYDPHEPYAAPEPFRTRFADDPYRGEIAALDHEIGRLLAGLEQRLGRQRLRVLVVGDHGEGRGEHGEMLHGNLLYQGVMRVPLLVAAPDLPPATRQDAVSVRQVAATLLAWAGEEAPGNLLEPTHEPVLAEAMQPFLQYRWQPQVMAVEGRHKVILAGAIELYDLTLDPAESDDLAGEVEPPRELVRAARDYPTPNPAAPTPDQPLNEEDRRRLASLGYVGGEGAAPVRPGAPRPAAMTALFKDLDQGSRWFVDGRYERAIPAFERVLESDPGNLMVAVRLAVAHSLTGDERQAMHYFERAREIDPSSVDRRHYLAMHHFAAGRFAAAAPLFEEVLAAQPARLAALESLARIRAREGRAGEAIALAERALAVGAESAPMLHLLGDARMQVGDTAGAIRDFERARAAAPADFGRDLELGVLYLAARDFAAARDALDRVPPSHPERAMALFKRAQVSVLLGEADRATRVADAWAAADATTRPLIEREPLFAGLFPGNAPPS